MANFGTHLTWPQPPRPTDSGVMYTVQTERAARGAGNAISRLARRAVAAMVRAIDEAPFDMAWPPASRPLGMRRDFGLPREKQASV
jgi:hypothetical protein